MKKIFIGFILFATFSATVIISVISSLTTEVDKIQSKYKEQIGKKFVLDKDTLTIVDYSSIMENFTLSNGKVVSASMVIKTN